MAREQFQTLTEPMYYILLVLTIPKHGYDIMQSIDALTKGRVRVGAGTLYSLLSRFEKEEMIFQLENDGRRKIYVLTEKGRQLLEDEHRRLKSLVEDGSICLKGD